MQGVWKLVGRIGLAWLMLGVAAPALATPITFFISLTSDQEATPTGSPAAGSASLTYDAATKLLTLNTLVVGIPTAELNDLGGLGPYHIHAGVPGQNGSILLGLGMASDWDDVLIGGVPLGISRSISDLDLTTVLDTAQIAELEARLLQTEGSKLYLNLHTLDFPGGEIRGNIPPIPEPGTALLLGLGLAGLARAGRPRVERARTSA